MVTGTQVSVIHCDNEKAHGKDFENECQENEIKVEFTTPYTSEQNGAGKRSEEREGYANSSSTS